MKLRYYGNLTRVLNYQHGKAYLVITSDDHCWDVHVVRGRDEDIEAKARMNSRFTSLTGGARISPIVPRRQSGQRAVPHSTPNGEQ